MNDNVTHPSHYTQGGIECIDAIRASLGYREFADYCKGNIIKYLWRYRGKNGTEDLRKAGMYLTWMLDAEERAEAKDKDKDKAEEKTQVSDEDVENLEELEHLHEEAAEAMLRIIMRQVAADQVCPWCGRKDCSGPNGCLKVAEFMERLLEDDDAED